MRGIRRLLIALVVLMALGSQSSSAQGIYYGVKGGVQFTDVSDRVNSDSKFGINFGGFAGYRLSGNVAVQLEVLYSFQGYVSGYDLLPNFSEAASSGANVNIDYLKVPAIAKIYLLDELNLEAGLSFNFLTSALSGGRKVSHINDFDLSIPLGIAYEISDNLEVGLRYEFSLSQLSRIYSGGNGLFAIGAAWRF